MTDVAVTMEWRHTMSTWNSFSELPVDKMSGGQPSGHYNWHVFCYVLERNSNVFEHYNEIKITVFSDVMPCSLVQEQTMQGAGTSGLGPDFMFISERLSTRPTVCIAMRQVMSHNLEHTPTRKVRSEVNGWRTFRGSELFPFLLCVFW